MGRRMYLISKCKNFKISEITISFGKRRQGRSGMGRGANNIACCRQTFITASPNGTIDLILHSDKRPDQLITLQ